MKSYLLTDNEDTLIGMRLIGIKGTVIESKDSLNNELFKIKKDNEIAIVFINDSLNIRYLDIINEFKEKNSTPLFTIIPDPKSSVSRKNKLTQYINETIGINIS